MFNRPELGESLANCSRPQSTVEVNSDKGTTNIPEAIACSFKLRYFEKYILMLFLIEIFRRSFVLCCFKHFCNAITKIDFLESKLKFPKYNMFCKMLIIIIFAFPPLPLITLLTGI